MRHIWIISILLAISAVFLMHDAAAQYDTPKAQLAAGVEPHDIGCNNDLVLAMRTAEISVCVRQSTAERMQWVVIATEFSKHIDDTSIDETFNVTQIKSEPPLPRTGTVHFKDLPRINHTGDMQEAYNEEEAHIIAHRIADAIDMTIGSAVDKEGKKYDELRTTGRNYYYTLTDKFGSHLGHIGVDKIFGGDSMNAGYFGNSHGNFVGTSYDRSMTHEEKVQFAVDVYHKIGYTNSKFSPPSITSAKNSKAITLIDNYLIVRHPSPENFDPSSNHIYHALGNNGGVQFKYYPGYTINAAESSLQIKFSIIFSNETRNRLNQPFPITPEEAKRTVYDFVSSSPLFNDEYHGCQINLNKYDEISVHGPFVIAGVPLYAIDGSDLGKCQYEKVIHWSSGGVSEQSSLDPPYIAIDAWTGQFINIGTTFGYCHGQSKDECEIVISSTIENVQIRFKLDDCWCRSNPQWKGECSVIPAYKTDGPGCSPKSKGWE